MTADGGPSQSDELWLQSLLITGLVLTYRTKSALGVLAWLNRGGDLAGKVQYWPRMYCSGS